MSTTVIARRENQFTQALTLLDMTTEAFNEMYLTIGEDRPAPKAKPCGSAAVTAAGAAWLDDLLKKAYCLPGYLPATLEQAEENRDALRSKLSSIMEEAMRDSGVAGSATFVAAYSGETGEYYATPSFVGDLTSRSAGGPSPERLSFIRCEVRGLAALLDSGMVERLAVNNAITQLSRDNRDFAAAYDEDPLDAVEDYSGAVKEYISRANAFSAKSA